MYNASLIGNARCCGQHKEKHGTHAHARVINYVLSLLLAPVPSDTESMQVSISFSF